MADKPKKKKSPPKTPFEKIGVAYESEARRQEKAGNEEMAKKTRQAAAKSMTPENKKALEESAQASKSKKGKKGKKAEKVDAVEAAGAKAKNAVDAAVERNPTSAPSSSTGKSTRRALPAGYGDYRSSRGKDAETQRATDREFDRLEAEDKEKDKPADRPNFGSVAEQRAKNPPPNSEYPNFGSVKEQREKNPPPNSAYPNFGSVAEQRAKAGPVQPSKLRAGAEGTSGKSGPVFRQNDITTEMPETRREKDEARTSRIKELATSGMSAETSDKGEMPSTKPTVLVAPTKDGEMSKSDKPGLMSRMRSRLSSFTSRSSAGSAPAKGGAGYPPPPPPSGGKTTSFAPPTQAVQAGQAYGDANTGTMNDYSINKRSTSSTVSVGGDMNIGNVHSQNLKSSGGGITATTSGKARSTKAGITASTTGSATSSHPRAQNASRGGRPTNKKK
jgi:hypothetical protein